MLIIFDFDGPLRSISWRGLLFAYRAIIRYKGKDPARFFNDMDEFKKWYQVDFRKNLKDIGGIKREDFPIINKIFHSHYDHRISLFPWVPGLLRGLSNRHEMAILSSSSTASVKASLTGLQRFFSVIVGSDDVKNIKPDPEGIETILERTEWDPSRALIIGDTDADIEAGKRAGIKTGIVGWGLCEWKDLIALDPDYKFKNPEDLSLL